MSSTFATVEDSNTKIAPTLNPGRITPEVLNQWERACLEYFRVKDVPDEKQVRAILSRLKDLYIADWAQANEETLIGLDFTAFMVKL